jgi:Putative cyclase
VGDFACATGQAEVKMLEHLDRQIWLTGNLWNGHDAWLVDSNGAKKNGIEKGKDRMVGRGVLLDMARFKGVDSLANGYGISTAELEACSKKQGVEVRAGDFVIFRTGQMERCLKAGKWSGCAGGDAPAAI